MDPLNLDDRRFADRTAAPRGDVGAETRFHYHEEPDGTVWARYEGGGVRLGHLTGRRNGSSLHFRYSHLDPAGRTASGVCESSIEPIPDGRLRLHESWAWDSRAGTGVSVLEEVVELADERLDVTLRCPDVGVTLRPLQLGDSAAIAALSGDTDIHRFTMITRTLDEAGAARRAAAAERARRAGSGVRLVVVDDATSSVLGEGGVSFLPMRMAELYYWLGPASRGRGIATAVLRRMCRWVVGAFDLGRLQLMTHPENEASQRVAEKVGFRQEGLVRGGLYVDELQEDVVLYGMLPGELVG